MMEIVAARSCPLGLFHFLLHAGLIPMPFKRKDRLPYPGVCDN